MTTHFKEILLGDFFDGFTKKCEEVLSEEKIDVAKWPYETTEGRYCLVLKRKIFVNIKTLSSLLI